MKITLVTVGKIKEKFYTDAVNEYIKRMSRFAKVSVDIFERETPQKECDGILKAMKGYTVALAVEGEKADSLSLAKKMRTLLDAGKELTFVIGSSSSAGMSARPGLPIASPAP